MLKRQLFFVPLFIFGLVHLATAQTIKFSEFDLDNGLHVILYPDNTSPTVTVGVAYNVGSKNEDPELTGFAHFFEHLMFEGTKNIPRGDYSKIVEKAGGALNAYTMVDKTYYYQNLPSNQVELGLWLEAERMLHAVVDSVGIATQKRVVAEEKKQRYDNRPYGDWMPIMMDMLFKEHPYRWVTIGDVEKLMEAKDEDFVNFYETYYVPNNACLVVAGDINEDQVKELVNKYYADIPKGTKHMHRPTQIEPPLPHEVRDTVYKDVQLPMLIQSFRIPEVSHDDYYAISMLNQILTAGKSSRLSSLLVDEKKIALQVQAFDLPYQDPTTSFILSIPSSDVDPSEVEETIDNEIKRLQNELISEKEHQKLLNQIESSMIYGKDKAADIADQLASNHIFYNNANFINEKEAKYMAVTREDIRRVAKKYFTKDNRVVLCYFPKSMQDNK